MDDFKKDLYFQLLAEASALGRKMISLEKLCESDDFAQLSIYHREKIKNQLVVMRHYLDIVTDRMKELAEDISVF